VDLIYLLDYYTTKDFIMSESVKDLEATTDQARAVFTYARAREWQREFDQLTDYSQYTTLREQAIAELDGVFPYLDRDVYMSGNGLFLIRDEATGLPKEEIWGAVPDCEGQHGGFMVLEDDEYRDTKKFKVMQRILLGGNTTMLSKTVIQQLLFFRYFDLDSSCIVLDEINDIFYDDFNTPNIEEQKNILVDSSLALNRLLKSTSFRRMKHSKQQRQVAGLVEKAEKETVLRGAKVLVEAEHGYICEFERKMAIKHVDVRNAVIGGVCLGLETLESLGLKLQAIRSDADLVQMTPGISLVFEPNLETREGLNLKQGQVFYLPVQQDFRIEKS
jgi:hypothetical protein